MPRKQTLQTFLSPRRLLELAGPKVYARGAQYAADDHVQLLAHTPDEAIAEVLGTHPYRVELKLTAKGLNADCTCPAMVDHGFCKHAVALGLHLMQALPAAGRTTAKGQSGERDSVKEQYPHIAGWIKHGLIEIGRDGYTTSIIRVLDEGGMIWEGGTRHRSMDKMLQEADQAIADWLSQN